MFSLNCKGRLLTVEIPLVMGIINVTPDSFYKGSRVEVNDVLKQVEHMLNNGADMIDIGAQSTRPGSEFLSPEQELQRLDKLISLLPASFPETVFSIDTFYSQVAKECIAAGFAMINDISGGEMDNKMISTAGKLNVPYICMHMRGTPQNMMQLNDYDNVTRAVLDYFIRKIEECRLAGIKDVVIDPGFGFSKNIAQNFELLKNLHTLQILGKPILAGLSRKSSIYKTLNITAEEALNGTTVMNTIALMNGANILRVHDVKEARECVRLFCRIN